MTPLTLMITYSEDGCQEHFQKSIAMHFSVLCFSPIPARCYRMSEAGFIGARQHASAQARIRVDKSEDVMLKCFP